MLEVPTIVKVGGSLFDMVNFGERLQEFLESLSAPWILLIPGGGSLVEQIRMLDRLHQLGDEKSHWLALRGMALTARILESVLFGFAVVNVPLSAQTTPRAILDAFEFYRTKSDALPPTWEVTSDSIALHVALETGARQLIYLKSVAIPATMPWSEASRLGFFDGTFPRLMESAPESLSVRVVNLRTWQAEPPIAALGPH